MPAKVGTQLSARSSKNRLVSRPRGNDKFGKPRRSLRRFQTADNLAASLLKTWQFVANTLTCFCRFEISVQDKYRSGKGNDERDCFF